MCYLLGEYVMPVTDQTIVVNGGRTNIDSVIENDNCTLLRRFSSVAISDSNDEIKTPLSKAPCL